MKRVFCIYLVLLLILPVLAVSVCAAEPAHVFSWENAQLFNGHHVLLYALPDGVYDVYVAFPDDYSARELIFDDLEVYFSSSYSDGLDISGSFVALGSDVGSIYSIRMFTASVDLDGITELTSLSLEYLDFVYNPDPDGGLEIDLTGLDVLFYPSSESNSESIESIQRVHEGIGVFTAVIGIFFELISGNPLFSALFAGSLILVCIPLYVELRKSSK